MRVEIAGAKITDDVAKTIERLQSNQVMTQIYYETIDDVTRSIALNLSDDDAENLAILSKVNILQLIRRDLLSLGEPLDVG